jgi:hypothetical protein
MINQLFHTKPDIELINEIINILGFDSIYSNKKIFKKDLEHTNIVISFDNIKDKIKENYISCKENYCENLNVKKCVTIARQHLKTIGYDIISEIVYIEGIRHITYRIVQQKIKKNIKNKLEFNISFS